MWLIDRETDGLGGTRIPLPGPLRTALVGWYSGRGSRRDEAAGITLVQQARIGRKWLACDCLGVDRLPPILTPAFLSEAETYYLRRLNGSKRPEHLAECPFFRDQVTHRINETRTAQTPADPPTGLFEVVRPAPENLAQRPDDDSSDDRTRSASVPRLARLLWRLIDISGLNIIPPLGDESRTRDIAEEFRTLIRAAAKIEIAPGIELARAFWTHGRALHSRRAYATIRDLARRWPQGHAPQGFLTLFAPGFRGSTLNAAGCEPLTIANRVQSPSIRENPIRGPFLTIVVVGEYPEAHGYAPLRAYAQPIFSGNRFVPIQSDFERDVIRSILDARHRLYGAGIDMTLEKPVFDRLTPLGTCRPDFVLEMRSRATGEIKRFVIDAAGGATDAYLASKLGWLPRLQQIAPVIAITPSAIADGKIHRMLWQEMEASS